MTTKHVPTLAGIEHLVSFPNPEYAKQEKLVARGTIKWRNPKVTPRVTLATSLAWGYAVPFGAVPMPVAGLIPDRVAAYLRPHQVIAARALVQWDCGVVVAPCGAGKTQIGVALIDAVPGQWMVVVHSVDLANQWAGRWEAITGKAAWKACGGRAVEDAPAGALVVATVQTLVKATPKGAWNVIVDEAHHAPAWTYTEVLGRMHTLRIYGLTATPERADGWTPAMLAWLGPIRHNITSAEMHGAGYTVAPIVRRVDTFAFTTTADWAQMLGQLSANEARNGLIAHMVGMRLSLPGPQMVLTSLVEHAETLARTIGAAAVVIHGKLGKKAREAAMDRLKSGDARVLIATQLADEGLDFPELHTVHMALPSRSASRTIQRAGRIMRAAPGKGAPVVYDYVDDDSLCLSQWRSRRRAYQSIGATFGVPK